MRFEEKKSVNVSANGNGIKNGNGHRDDRWHGHNREEVSRLIIQSLYDLGYDKAAETLEEESGYAMESAEVAAFRKSVLEGSWTQAEELLQKLEIDPMADMNVLLFDVRQQKFLELLESRELARALQVLRTELTPLTENYSVEKLHFLSSLMMLSPEDIKSRAQWDGAKGGSRDRLLQELSLSIAPDVMIPEHRLSTLLQQVRTDQIAKCLYHNMANAPSLFCDHQCDRDQFPLSTIHTLRDHTDEVWYVQFSYDGTRLATASKDGRAIIWDVETYKPLHFLEDHEGPVAYLKWSPDDQMILTCSHDKTARLWNTNTGECTHVLMSHEDSVSSCAWAPDGQTFVTGSLDKKMLVWTLDGNMVYKYEGDRIYDLTITPDGERLLAICTEKKVHIYDYITKVKYCEITMPAALTSICVSSDSRYFVVNMASQEVELWSLATLESVRKYKGQQQGEFVIKSCFGGTEENFVVSGSEDSSIYVWHKDNGVLMEKLAGHHGTVNCVAWSPTNPHMFASASDDTQVRLWSVAAADGKRRL